MSFWNSSKRPPSIDLPYGGLRELILEGEQF